MKYVDGDGHINMHERSRSVEEIEDGNLYAHALRYTYHMRPGLELFKGSDYSSVPSGKKIKIVKDKGPVFNENMNVTFLDHPFKDEEQVFYISGAYFI